MTRSEKIGRLTVILTAVLWAANAAAAWLMWFYKGVREYLYVRQNG